MTRGRILAAVGLVLLTSSPAVAGQAATAGWSATRSMSAARDHFAAALLETGRLLVVGGEVTPRAAEVAARLPDGTVLVAGGHRGAGATASTEICTGC